MRAANSAAELPLLCAGGAAGARGAAAELNVTGAVAQRPVRPTLRAHKRVRV